MAGGNTEELPQPSDAKRLEKVKKRKLSQSPARDGSSSGRRASPDQDELPQPFDAKKLEPAKKRQRSQSPSETIRKPKRPGQRARMTEADKERIRQRQAEREKEAAAAAAAAAATESRSAISDVVRQHYNAVPERGRDWRKTGSKIKGLRSFNNWVKSTIIQKFSPDEDHTPGAHERGRDMVGAGGHDLLVLDIGCGKGGDLGKWQQAPQTVGLYVGLDPADVSIAQAKDRYHSMGSRGGGGRGRGGYRGGRQQRPFDAFFFTKDCFGESIENIDIIQKVGRNGFDIVTMMFCMHYAYESEDKARMMLRNVSGALKKGGRFIGCIPNSEVIGDRVTAFNKRITEKKAAQERGDEVPASEEPEEGEAEETAEWGNDLYRVRFPGKTPPDGDFRPPFGWKYNFYLDEAVEEVPEYVVPWYAFRHLAGQYNLELQYEQSFSDIWESEKDDPTLGPLSERMGVRERGGGPLLVSPEEMEVASFYKAFCFYKV